MSSRPPRVRAFLRLLRWLGPWAGDAQVPGDVRRERWVLRSGALRGRRADRLGLERAAGDVTELSAYVYRPRGEPLGHYVVVPGLHFDGPDDVRLDRFCRVLSHAGFEVVAPFVPAYVDLRVAPTAPDDVEQVVRAVARRIAPDERVTLFSISFGSWPALEVAARLPEHVDAVVTFGGYADFESSVRFAVDGVMRSPDGDFPMKRDPLNVPALFLNVLPFIDDAGDPRPLERAWREMAYRTWGRMELKAPGRLAPIAREVAEDVPPAQRELFLIGCGVVPGAEALVTRALERARDALAFASPRAACERVRTPVVICHGRDDDVIPWGEAPKLERALCDHVPVRLLLTGLYGHTGSQRPSASALAKEARTLLAIARCLAAGGAVRHWVSAED